MSQTTPLIDARGLAKSEAQPGDPIPLLAELLLDLEQNRFAFISSGDPDAAVHELYNRPVDSAEVGVDPRTCRMTRRPTVPLDEVASRDAGLGSRPDECTQHSIPRRSRFTTTALTLPASDGAQAISNCLQLPMHPTSRIRLLFGPSSTPRARLGAVPFDEARG